MIDQDFSAEDLRLSFLQEATTAEEAFWIEVASALLPGALEPIPLRLDRACPDEETLLAWVNGSLSASEQSAVESHLEVCAACAARRDTVAESLAATEKVAAEFVPMPEAVFASLMAQREKKPLWERLPFPELRRLVEQGQAEAVAAWKSLRQFGECVRNQVEQTLASFTPAAPALICVPVRGRGKEAQPEAGPPPGQPRLAVAPHFSGGVLLEEGPEIDADGQFRLAVALTDAEGRPDLTWDGWRMKALLVLPEAATGEPEVRLPLAEVVIRNSGGSVQVPGVAEILSLPGGSLPPAWVELMMEPEVNYDVDDC